jgi:hypothetical protein
MAGRKSRYRDVHRRYRGKLRPLRYMLAANTLLVLRGRLVCCWPHNRQFRKPCRGWIEVFKNGHQWREMEMAFRQFAVQAFQNAGKPLPPDLK